MIEIKNFSYLGQYGFTSNPFSKSYTVPADTNCLVVIVAIRDADVVDSIKWDGDAFTKTVERDSGGQVVQIWTLANPTIGAGDVDFTVDGTSDGGIMIYSLAGVDTSDLVEDTDSAQGDSSSLSLTVTTANPGAIIIDGVYDEDGSPLPSATGSNQIQQDAKEISLAAMATSYYIKSDTGNETFSWTIDDADWRHAIVALNALPEAGGFPINHKAGGSFNERVMRVKAAGSFVPA